MRHASNAFSWLWAPAHTRSTHSNDKGFGICDMHCHRLLVRQFAQRFYVLWMSHYIQEIRQFIFELEILDREHVPMHTCSLEDSCPTTSPFSIQTISHQMQQHHHMRNMFCPHCAREQFPGPNKMVPEYLAHWALNKQKIMSYTEPEHRTSSVARCVGWCK